MTHTKTEDTIRILTILKLDTQSVFNRMTQYFPEYINILALKRSRDHFKELCVSKYDTVRFEDLRFCGPELLVELDRFYQIFFEIKWYLFHTEDMPNRMEDRVRFDLKELSKAYQNLELYLNVEFDTARSNNQSAFIQNHSFKNEAV